MAETAGLREVADAIKSAWNTAGLNGTIQGGFHAFVLPHKTAKPYALLEDVGGGPVTTSSKGRYDDLTFVINVAGNDFAECSFCVGKIQGALPENGLTIVATNGAGLLTLMQGKVTYFEEDRFVRATCEYTAKIKQNRIRT